LWVFYREEELKKFYKKCDYFWLPLLCIISKRTLISKDTLQTCYASRSKKKEKKKKIRKSLASAEF
jgi:hypothetical protein